MRSVDADERERLCPPTKVLSVFPCTDILGRIVMNGLRYQPTPFFQSVTDNLTNDFNMEHSVALDSFLHFLRFLISVSAP